MLVYAETLGTFYNHINQNIIDKMIVEKSGRQFSASEMKSFRMSLPAIANSLRNVSLPLDVEVALEYKIPLTSKRIDFLIAGEDEYGKSHILICELKQWDKVTHTDMNDIVLVGNEEHVHPSWQAYSYGTTLANFNEYIYNNDVEINTCTFLHNYQRQYVDEICNSVYLEGITKTPPFISDQFVDLAKFVSKYIKKKSSKKLLFEVENGRIKPSKMLASSIASMLNGNKEYELIDSQRIVYSNLLNEIKINQKSNEKHVFIIRGGAGTGKSLIAIQLLSSLINDKGYTAFYVAKSSYVKENYYKMLTKDIPNFKFLRTLFLGSGSFIDSQYNEFDVLIVDEAHRLTKKTKKSHFYYGENQIKEIIHAAKTSIFFIDETQNVDIKDFGTIQNICDFAKEEGAKVHLDDKYILQSQFRCNGSDEYINWLNCILYNKPYTNSGTCVDYDIRIIDDIVEWKSAIISKNVTEISPSRMLSGDVFEWKSKDDKNAIDINIGDFKAQWNKTKAFATDSKSINEVGCIHTSQGMEFNYCGVIVGNDLKYENGKVVTNYLAHPEKAGEFRRPYKRKIDPSDYDTIDNIIRNTYKVLLTRGQKGCYLYVMDDKLKVYLKQKINELKNVC